MTNVLLVCHANTCRSVMAHVLLEKMLAARGTNGAVRVRSGGIANHARDGMIPSLDARIVLREDDIHLAEDAFASTDLRRHRDIVAAADLIVTMTAQQKETIGAYAEAQGRPVLTLARAGRRGAATWTTRSARARTAIARRRTRSSAASSWAWTGC